MDSVADKQLAHRTADLLSLADVHRWTIIRTLRHQSVAEHAFGVAVIAAELYTRLSAETAEPWRADVERAILWWALIHDAPETLTGDIDGRFKREFPVVADAVREAEAAALPWLKMDTSAEHPWVRWIVKAADLIEAIAFIREWGSGSRADAVYHELATILNREVVPRLAEATGGDAEEVRVIVGLTLNRILSQTYNYQERNGSVQAMEARGGIHV